MRDGYMSTTWKQINNKPSDAWKTNQNRKKHANVTQKLDFADDFLRFLRYNVF